MAQKLIAFGCSFTSYIYPSYADILGAKNYGISGAGNERIFYEVLKQYNKNNLHNYNGVIVQWSGINRFDYMTPKGWTPPDGALFLSDRNKHIWKNIKGWYNESYELEKTVNYITCIRALLNQAKIPFYFMSMNKLRHPDIGLNNLQKKYTGTYEFVKGASWTRKSFIDEHPTVKQHVDIAQKCATHFNLELSDQALSKADQVHEKILQQKVFTDYYL